MCGAGLAAHMGTYPGLSPGHDVRRDPWGNEYSQFITGARRRDLYWFELRATAGVLVVPS